MDEDARDSAACVPLSGAQFCRDSQYDSLVTWGVRGGHRAPDVGWRPTAAGAIGRVRVVALLTLPLCVLAVIVALDALAGESDSLLLTGIRDEPEHLATAWLFLAAFLPLRGHAFYCWALLGSVVIDLDHIPLYLWNVLTADEGSRPVTHSLATVVLLAAGGAVVSPRHRTPLLGLALGVLLHFVRDLADGPGIPAFWPLTAYNVTMDHTVSVVVLTVVAVAAAVRRLLTAPPRLGQSPSTTV